MLIGCLPPFQDLSKDRVQLVQGWLYVYLNVWGVDLEMPENRTVVDVAKHILTGAAYLYRIQNFAGQGIDLPPDYLVYSPEQKR